MTQNLSEKLQRRFQLLRDAKFANFHSTVRIFFTFYDGEDTFKNISKALSEEFPAMPSRLNLFLNNSGEVLRFSSEREAAVYGEQFLRKISEEAIPPRQIYDEVYLRSNGSFDRLPHQHDNDERSLVAVKEQFLEPFCLYVTEKTIGSSESSRSPADIDPLVGMFRKEVFKKDRAIKSLMAAESGKPLSLIFVDLDNFGEVNKKYSQSTGDEVLKTVGTRMLSIVSRRGDCYRDGGEELGVLLENHDADEAKLLAERILAEISNDTISERELTITASIGVATLPRHADTADQLMEKADAAMRTAKRLGKNRVVIFGEDFQEQGRAKESTKSDEGVFALSSFLAEAKELAEKKDLANYYDIWRTTPNGVEQTYDTFYNICSRIETNFHENAAIFNSLGIEFIREDGLVAIHSKKYGSQIQLLGYDKTKSQWYVSDLNLLLVLYEKSPVYSGKFITEGILQFQYTADLNNDRNVVWQDAESSEIFDTDDIYEKFFELLINKLSEE